MSKNKYFFIGCMAFLAGCSMLSGEGKDNTPPPAPLTPFCQACKTQMVWQSHVGPGADRAHPRLETTVFQGIAYTVNTGGGVNAINAFNGRTLWSVDTGTHPSSGPFVQSGYLVFGTSKGEVVALNSQCGRLLWRAPVSTELLAPPVIAGRLVLTKAVDGQVKAFDLMTGKLRWTFTHKTPLVILHSDSSPVVVNNQVYIGFSDGQLVALQLQTGQLLWERMIGMPRGVTDPDLLVGITADPRSSGALLYVAAYQNKVMVFSRQTGRLVWEQPISTFNNFDLCGSLMVITDDHGIVWGLNRFNGKILWRQTVFQNRILTAPVIKVCRHFAVEMPGQVWIGDAEGYLHILSSQNGCLIGRHFVDSSGVFVPPVVGGAGVLARSESGLFMAVNSPG